METSATTRSSTEMTKVIQVRIEEQEEHNGTENLSSRLLKTLAIGAGGVVITACQPSPTPTAAVQPTTVPPTAVKPAATIAPAATSAPTVAKAVEDYSKATRKETVIFDIDGGRVVAPDLWHPYLPTGARRDQGFHQCMLEPLQILNYETGELTNWLAESFTSNSSLDVWTLKLRKGITWSDGKPMTADDVVFTVELAVEKRRLLQQPGFKALA